MQDNNFKSNQMKHIDVIIASSRLPFLVLAPVCILLALVSIEYSFDVFKPFLSFIILLGAVSAHISVNLFNEYLDFKSGLDFKTNKTPFSGGSGSLLIQPDSFRCVLVAAIVTLLITSFCGLYLLSVSFVIFDTFNSSLLWIGLLGVLIVLLYTGPINRHPWLCFISPGLGFGFLMVYGASSAILGRLPLELFPASLLLFLLVNNLLLLNQLPDIEADASIGRKHLWIVKGRDFAFNVYLFTTLLIPLLFLVSILCKLWPVLSALALLPWCLTLFSWWGAKKQGLTINKQPKFLAMNVMATLGVPVVLSIVLCIYA